MLFFRDAQEAGSKEWSTLQIERPQRFFPQPARFSSALVIGKMPQIDGGQCQRQPRRDDLHWLSLDGGKRRAQGIVPRDDLVEASLERSDVERSNQS